MQSTNPDPAPSHILMTNPGRPALHTYVVSIPRPSGRPPIEHHARGVDGADALRRYNADRQAAAQRRGTRYTPATLVRHHPACACRKPMSATPDDLYPRSE